MKRIRRSFPSFCWTVNFLTFLGGSTWKIFQSKGWTLLSNFPTSSVVPEVFTIMISVSFEGGLFPNKREMVLTKTWGCSSNFTKVTFEGSFWSIKEEILINARSSLGVAGNMIRTFSSDLRRNYEVGQLAFGIYDAKSWTEVHFVAFHRTLETNLKSKMKNSKKN